MTEPAPVTIFVDGLKPGDVWPLPPDQLDELAELLINSMIRHRQAKKEFRNGNEPVSGEAAPRPAEATQTVD